MYPDDSYVLTLLQIHVPAKVNYIRLMERYLKTSLLGF